MQHLSKLANQEKRDILSNVIKRKCRYRISDRRLELILNNLNIQRPYVVKAIRNSTKFLNIVTEENIVVPEKKILSYVTKLYGSFQSGFFQKNEWGICSLPGMIHHHEDAAAIKRSIMQIDDQPITVTYTLVLYDADF